MLSLETYIPNIPNTVTIADIPDMCLYDAPLYLVELIEGGLPVGASFSGNGVVANTFSPVIAGLGTHTITYQITAGTPALVVGALTQTKTVNVIACDDTTARLKIASCCFADMAYEAVALLKKGLKEEYQAKQGTVRWLYMAIEFLKTWFADADEVLPTCTLVVQATLPNSNLKTINITWNGVSIGSVSATSNTTVFVVSLVGSINNNSSGFKVIHTTNIFGAMTFTITAPSSKYCGSFQVSVANNLTLTSISSFSGGSPAIINCVSQDGVDKMFQGFTQICGCDDCRSRKEIMDDTVKLSGGRSYNVKKQPCRETSLPVQPLRILVG